MLLLCTPNEFNTVALSHCPRFASNFQTKMTRKNIFSIGVVLVLLSCNAGDQPANQQAGLGFRSDSILEARTQVKAELDASAIRLEQKAKELEAILNDL